MKTARILVAVLSLAALAACGNDSITGSMAPASARHSTATAPLDDTTTAKPGDATVTSGDPLRCEGTLVTTTDSSGNVTTTCVTDEKQAGSGG